MLHCALRRGVIAGIMINFASSSDGQVRLHNVGGLPGSSQSQANGISADGTAVTGVSFSETTPYRGFRWSLRDGIEDLGVRSNGGAYSVGTALNSDGSVITGWSLSLPGLASEAIRWTRGGGIEGLGIGSEGTGISVDGSVICGTRYFSVGASGGAFRWTRASGVEDLVTPGGRDQTRGLALNADGSIVVGQDGGRRAFWWSRQAGMRGLGVLAGYVNSVALAVSASGDVVVGYCYTDSRERAFRWTASTGMQDLGILLAESSSRALTISADGTVIGGVSWSSAGYFGFLHTSTLGMVNVRTYLRSLGEPQTAWQLQDVTGVSANGSSIVGIGIIGGQYRPWFATGLPLHPCLADIDDGSNFGTPDGGVTMDDLLYYLDGYARGLRRADVDNDARTGIPDGRVTAEDLIYYMIRFEQGC